ncbi:MAG TPA: hypothetical protein VF173_27140 [Thermoanaerobaculia bacterium]|nr:hypothetical protein [Thermoanaerobaculia bacterium]
MVIIAGLILIAGRAFAVGETENYVLAMFMFAYSIAKWISSGRVEMKPHDWMQQLSSLRFKSLPPGLSGTVLKCPQDSELWRDVVRYLAPLVDAAVISAPQNTPSLDWEVKTLRDSLGSRKMIVLKSHDSSPCISVEGMQVIDVPTPGSWWHNYRVSYYGSAWKKATSIVFNAIEK